MAEPTPSPSLDEFLAMRESDGNAWWRLDSGDHLNLFEEALDGLEQLRSGKRINVYVAEELMTLRARIAELERENIRLSGIEQLHCGDSPVPDDKAEWWTPPMRTPIGQWIKGMFEHPCDGMPYSEDGYDARGPIITVRNLIRSVRMAEQEVRDQ